MNAAASSGRRLLISICAASIRSSSAVAAGPDPVCDAIGSPVLVDVSAAAQEQNERTIETNCDIVREDFGICERSQANLEGGIFQRGPLSPKHEVGVRYFHDRVRQAMARESSPAGTRLGISDCCAGPKKARRTPRTSRRSRLPGSRLEA